MACLEHYCAQCGWFRIDNTPTAVCPQCGSPVTNDFDEPVEREPVEIEDDEPQ